jgi:PAS domain S-box-containing protein
MFRPLRYLALCCLTAASLAALWLFASTEANSLFAGYRRDILGISSVVLMLLCFGALYVLARYADRRHQLHQPRSRVEPNEESPQQRGPLERQLADTQATLQAVMANTFNAIISIDQQGKVLSFNATAERMFGYPQQRVVGNNVSMLMPAPHARQHDTYIANYLRTGQAAIIGGLRALQGRREDGSEFPMELAIIETKASAGPIFVGTIRDISERELAEKALLETRQKYYHQEKMAAIGFLSAGLVHEIGNPIAAISGLLQGICDPGTEHLPCNARANQQLRMVQEQVARIIKITHDVSEFATPQAQEPDLQDLNALIGRTTGLMRHDRRFSEVELRLELDTQIPAIYGVGDHLIQVLMNLLVNAVDAVADNHPQPGIIIVSTGSEADRVWFEVADNGCGMSAEVLAHARDAFYTTKPVGRGSGLGLSLCQSLLSEQGGTMTIRSQSGIGTWIRVTLLTQTAAQESAAFE